MSDAARTAAAAPLRPSRPSAVSAVALAAAAAVLVRSGPSVWSVVAAAAAAVLVWVAAIDLETRLLPNRIVLPATACVLAASAVLGLHAFAVHAVGCVGVFALLFLAAAIRPGDLGMGDVKLALLLGALLGRGVLTALLIGFGLVAVLGLFELARGGGRAALRRQIPLGPFLAAGAVATLVLSGAS